MSSKKDLYDQILLDFANVYDVDVDNLGTNFKADSAVLSSIEYSVLLRINEVAQNVWVGSCDVDTLLIIGAEKLGRVPYAAKSGNYSCSTTATTGTTTIPLGTQFKKGDYIYESLFDISPGSTIFVRALTAGSESALIVGDELTSVTPITSAEDTITVSSINVNPQDGETIAEYRADVVNSYVLRASGGNASDYILWAGDVSEVRTVYPYAADGAAGKVNIYCEGLSPDFVPNSAIIDEVIEAIKYDTDGVGRVLVDLFPFINDTYIVPVQKTDVNVTILGGESSEQAAATTIIEDYLYNKRPYIPSLSKIRVATDDTLTQVEIIKALADSNITFTGITLTVKPLGGTEQTVTTYRVGLDTDPTYYGEIPVLETLTIS